MEKWDCCRQIVEIPSSSTAVDVEDRLVKLLGSQTLATSAPKKYTEEEKKIREAILSQYSQLSDNEVGEDTFDLQVFYIFLFYNAAFLKP